MSETAAVRRAALGIVHAMIFADGEVSDKEVDWLLRIVSDHPIFDGCSSDELTGMLRATFEEAKKGALPKAVENWAKQIPPHLNTTIFALALRAMMADGVIARGEDAMALHLRALLNIPDREAAEMLKTAIRRAGA